MKNEIKKLGDAELEIMQVIWSSGGKITSSGILKELEGHRNWALSTLMTSLSRLGDKGFVDCDRTGGTNLYSAKISENDYKAGASGSFLDRLYNHSVRNLVATLYSNKMIGDDDVRELREYLDRLECERK